MRKLTCFAIVPNSRDKGKPTEMVKDQRHGLVEKSFNCNAVAPCSSYSANQGPPVNYEDVYELIISQVIDDLNKKIEHRQMEIILERGIDLPRAGAIATHLAEQLCLADITITDITSLNPNVLFELGVRLTVKAHLNVLICHEGTEIPFNLTGIRYIPYDMQAKGSQLARSQIISQIMDFLDHPDQYSASAESWYRGIDLYTGRESNTARLKSYGDVPELVARLASHVLQKKGKNLKVKNEIKQFFNSVGQSLIRYPQQAVKHYQVMLGIEGLSDEDKYEIVSKLYDICKGIPALKKEKDFYKQEMDKLE